MIPAIMVLLLAFLSILMAFSCQELSQSSDCKTLPPGMLVEILGPAYNPRYMSIEEPPEEMIENEGKRAAGGANGEFYVDNDFVKDFGDEPAWTKKYGGDHVKEVKEPKSSLFSIFDTSSSGKSRRKIRSANLWGCDAHIRWADLGAEFFPRYIRSVECMKATCWYGHFHCRPRSFTIKILRRRKGRCVFVGGINSADMVNPSPEDFRELWVWEERAVNFCCDCSR